ncbi:MAG: Holliday junction branch migration protein RuvA [Elusimicrobiota bacterium]
MYAYLLGNIVSVRYREKGEPCEAWLEAGGIGFRVHVAASTARSLGAGQEATLYVSQSAAMYGGETTLYGFLSDDERRLFELLWGIPGAGAKKALDYFDKVKEKSPLRFLQALAREDAKFLTAFFGFTAKTAGRMIAQLKEKAEPLLQEFSAAPAEAALPFASAAGSAGADDGDLWQRSRNALASLGFDARESAGALNAILGHPSLQPRTLESLVKEAIRELSLKRAA